MQPARLHRRSVLGLAAAAALPAATRAQQDRRYAVISLIGDEIVLVYPTAEVGSALDRNHHRELPDPAGALDRYALAEMARGIEASGAGAALLQVPPGALHQAPEPLVDGSEIALPEAWVQQIEQARATHVLLLTKSRGPARVELANSSVGSGKLRGLGYYVDRSTRLRMSVSGRTGTGFIAPYVYVQLTLADARNGRVLARREIQATRSYPLAQSQTASDPWAVLDAGEKVQRLRTLLQRELARELPPLLAG